MNYDINHLTFEEKLRLLTGKDFWQTYDANGKLDSVFMSDGPNGLRKCDGEHTEESIAMPCISALANSWSEETVFTDSATIADECAEKGVDILLAPGVNIKRTPLCGRNFEYFSEDPYLSGILAKAYIRGLQENGVGACIKHFCCNNREYDREFISSEADERTLREIYVRPFEIALEAEPWLVMCSYNPVNGIYASENKKILKDLLRKRLGFSGVIVSDWGAVHNSYKALKATLDLRMAFDERAYGELKTAYERGLITDAEINFSADNLLRLLEKVQNAKKERRKVRFSVAERRERALSVARESIVLLKNEGALPLDPRKSVYVAGGFSSDPPYGGGGSSKVRTTFKSEPLARLICERTGAKTGFRQHFSDDGMFAEKCLLESAAAADRVVLCVGEDERKNREGADRITLRLSEVQENAIKMVGKVNKNVTVVVYAGGAIDMSPWIHSVNAVVYAGFCGETVNLAVADILTGKVCPSGKLAETFPLSIADTVAYPYEPNGYYDRYEDGIFVGYRRYDRDGKEVLFPFGYGLSYANFVYSDLVVRKAGETSFTLSFDVENLSSVSGKEVVQVYVKDIVSSVSRPEKELKGFVKKLIEAGKKERITIRLEADAFAFYSAALDEWYVENGDYEIQIGSSSRDIRLKARVKIELPLESQYTVEKADLREIGSET